MAYSLSWICLNPQTGHVVFGNMQDLSPTNRLHNLPLLEVIAQTAPPSTPEEANQILQKQHLVERIFTNVIR